MELKIISRLKQGLIYLFVKYNSKNDEGIRKILSLYEFQIFSKMSNYDKVHSFNLLKKVQKNKLLSDKELYWKLALLHDSAKKNASLLRRIKKVFVGDKFLDKHSERAYEILKEHNLELALLCKNHHKETQDVYMKEFQNLDDR